MKKTVLSLLIVFMAMQMCMAKIITITKKGTRTESDPNHVSGNTYRANDGTLITLQPGQNANSPSVYGEHGMPTKTVEYTYTITIEIPDNVYDIQLEPIVGSTIDFCDKNYRKSGDKKVEISYTSEEKGIERVYWNLQKDTKCNVTVSGKLETKIVSRTADEIKTSNSAQIGDPVLMTSGQYRYDETDAVITAGNAQLELGRHYQSGENKGESIGRKWFFSLDSRIIRGTSTTAESEYSDFSTHLAHQEEILATLRRQRTEAASAFDTDINTIRNDITDMEETSEKLSTGPYNGEKEVRDYIRQIDDRISVLNSCLFIKKQEKATYLAELGNTIAETENMINEERSVASSLQNVAAHSVYNRNCNSRAVRGYGFDEHTDIGTEIIIVYDTYGRKSLFKLKTSPIFSGSQNLFPNGAETENISGGTDTLRIKPDGSYDLIKRDGTVWHYGTDGMIQTITDRYGNTISISYRNGMAESVNANGKKLYTFEWQNGRISSLVNARDNAERTSYFYTSDLLTSVKDNDGDTISFAYASGSLLTTIRKPDGSSTLIDYNLEMEGKKLAGRTRNEEGAWELFAYSQSGKKVEHTTHSGVKTVYQYDDEQRLKKQTDCDGTTKEYTYDENGNITQEILNGNRTIYTVNDKGDRIRASYSDGSFETWTYDSFGSVTSYRDRDGIQYEYVRDTKGRLISLRCGGKTLYSYVYDAKGRIISFAMQRADGTLQKESYSYDEYGNLSERITGEGQGSSDTTKESWTYDGRNRIVSYSINGEPEESYSYNGRTTTVSYRNGLIAEYVTNSRKDCVSVKEKDSLTGEVRLTETEYDKRHLPLKQKLSSGDGCTVLMTAEYRYLPGGEPEAELINDGKSCVVTIYGYKDKNGNQLDYVTETKRLKCTVEELTTAGMTGNAGFNSVNLASLYANATDKYTVSYDYTRTQNGLKVTTTAPDGTTTVAEYDAWSRLKSVTDALGTTSAQEYSSAGRIKKQQTSYGGFYVYQYDGAGSLSGTGTEGGRKTLISSNPDGTPFRVTDRTGRTTEYTYDTKGNVRSITTPAGTKYQNYDKYGRITLTLIGGNGDISTAEEYTSYSYSPDGRALTVNRGGLYSAEYTLNAWGETTSVTDGERNTNSFVYDCAGRITSQKDAYGNETLYEYNEYGLATKICFPDGTLSEYEYDVFGNITEERFCGKTTYKAHYDNAGRVIETEGDLSAKNNYLYDEVGKIRETKSGSERKMTYEYSDRGRTVSVKDGKGKRLSYQYDAYGKLVSETNRIGLSRSYTYDDEERLTETSQFSGKKVRTELSPDGLTRKTIYDDGSFDIVTYTLSGKISSITNGTGTVQYEYDKGGMLIRQTDFATGETVTFTYDKSGRRTYTKGAGRNIIMKYGKNGELTEINDFSSSVGYKIEYDCMMRETRRTGNNGVRTETRYNRNGSVDMIVTKDKNGIVLNAEAYVYGDDGRKEAAIDKNYDVTLYEYDSQGRLITVLHPDTKGMRDYEKEIIEEYGIAGFHYEASESRYIKKNVYDKVAELQNLCHNINGMIPVFRSFRTEKFSYDANGNRTGWFIGGGFLEYTCDDEDRLISCSTGGKTVKKYLYDDDGNNISVLNPANPENRINYDYDGKNRMCMSVTYGDDGAGIERNYGYDALGRRVCVSSQKGKAIRAVYDGLGFDTLTETRSIAADDLTETNIGLNAAIPKGERYRFITDDTVNDGQRNGVQGATKTVYEADNFRSRKTLYIGGEPAAVSADGINLYLGCDETGSVKLITDAYGLEKASVAYDVFGKPVAENASSSNMDAFTNAVISRAAYAGKPYDYATGLYDFGYRDYSPTLARFTTPDPIRDGINWYSYCAGDPINFVDAWGLKQIIAGDIVQLINDSILSNSTGSLKDQTQILIQRSPDDNGNNGKYYQSTLSVMINDDINIFSAGVQSTADHDKLNNGELQYEGGTLDAGKYKGTFLNKSASYNNAISITGNGIEEKDAILVHPDAFTAKGETKSYSAYGKPYSLGCQILELENFEKTINQLSNLGFKGGFSQNESWSKGDSIKIEIKAAPNKKGK